MSLSPLRVGLVLLSVAAVAVAAEVTVQSGETLPKVAQRTLGDANAASELKAINKLSSDQVPAGTVLQLPGTDRNLAVSAISAARNAVKQAGVDSPKRDEAARQLAQAETLLKNAQYREAASAADGAWKLVAARADEKTQFTIEVAKDGKTEVKSTAGQPVRVEAQGRVEPVYAGETVTIAKGEIPRKALEKLPEAVVAEVRRLAAPEPLAPAEKGQLKLQPQKGGALGPVVLTWKPVEGATSYDVELVRSGGKALTLKVQKPEARLNSLQAGSYLWTVRAVGDGVRSDKSPKRTFELTPDTLKLEVKGTQWK